MDPTLHNGEILYEDLFFDEINRYDIIVFKAPNGDEQNDYCVKRVYGLPGDKVNIVDGDIYINGEKLDDPYYDGKTTSINYTNKEVVVGKDQYFVLGDNREVSTDSRSDVIGLVPRALIRSVVRK